MRRDQDTDTQRKDNVRMFPIGQRGVSQNIVSPSPVAKHQGCLFLNVRTGNLVDWSSSSRCRVCRWSKFSGRSSLHWTKPQILSRQAASNHPFCPLSTSTHRITGPGEPEWTGFFRPPPAHPNSRHRYVKPLALVKHRRCLDLSPGAVI